LTFVTITMLLSLLFPSLQASVGTREPHIALCKVSHPRLPSLGLVGVPQDGAFWYVYNAWRASQVAYVQHAPEFQQVRKTSLHSIDTWAPVHCRAVWTACLPAGGRRKARPGCGVRLHSARRAQRRARSPGSPRTSRGTGPQSAPVYVYVYVAYMCIWRIWRMYGVYVCMAYMCIWRKLAALQGSRGLEAARQEPSAMLVFVSWPRRPQAVSAIEQSQGPKAAAHLSFKQTKMVGALRMAFGCKHCIEHREVGYGSESR
jgi:hypothetical protein